MCETSIPGVLNLLALGNLPRRGHWAVSRENFWLLELDVGDPRNI